MLDMAALVASWSKDPSTQVGAVIADKKNRVISLGFNGFPRNIQDHSALLEDRDEKLRRTIHAEENALLFATQSVEGCTIYVTHPPCARCAAKIIQSGIERVVVKEVSDSFLERWADDWRSATMMFREAGILFENGSE